MLELKYSNISPTSKADSTNTTNDKKDWVNMADLSKDIVPKQYASLEPNRTKLNGKFADFPDTAPINQGYESEEMSDANGDFATPITITRIFSKNHTAPGIQFIFDNGDDQCYCNSLNVKWYRDNTLLYDKNYTPNNSIFFCEQNVTAFNKIIITFNSTSKPYRFLRIFDIQDGQEVSFGTDKLQGLKVIEEISEAGDELSINTCNAQINTNSNVEFMFLRTQKMRLYDDNNLLGKFFTDNSIRKNSTQYTLDTVDSIGLLENTTFLGGIYSNKSVAELLAEILGDMQYEYNGEDVVTGYIPVCNKRTALKYIAFATGLTIDCSRSNSIKFLKLDDTVKTISEGAVIRSPKETTNQIATRIDLTEYTYKAENTGDTELLNEVVDGIQTIIFGKPYSEYLITGGTIISSGANYVTLQGTGNTVVLTGVEYAVYQKIVSISNTLVTAEDVDNIISKTECTLINPNNSAEVLSRLAGIYFKQKELTGIFKITNEKVGDMVSIPTEFGRKTGRLVSLEYDPRNYYAQFKVSEVIAL